MAFICGYCGSWRDGNPPATLNGPRKGDGVIEDQPICSACVHDAAENADFVTVLKAGEADPA